MDKPENITLSEKLVHYDNVRQDIRDEMKQRITQRDNLANQFFVMMGTTIAGVLAATEYLLLLLPVVAFYFTSQILYSYQIHGALSYFLIEKIEKNITKILGSNDNSEWQSFISSVEEDSDASTVEKSKNKERSSRAISSGVRKNFFVWCMWGVSVGSMACLAILFSVNRKTDLFHIIILVVCSAIYILLNAIATYRFVFKRGNYELPS